MTLVEIADQLAGELAGELERMLRDDLLFPRPLANRPAPRISRKYGLDDSSHHPDRTEPRIGVRCQDFGGDGQDPARQAL